MESNTNIGHAFKYTTVHAKAENGKICTTFYYNQDAINEKSDELFIGAVFKDPDGNVVKLNDDNSFTVVYDSVDPILNGVNYYADVSYYQLKNNEEGTHKIPATSTKTLNFRLDLAVKPVKLTDPTTGVSVYTTTKYVSENAALVSSDVPTDSAAYKTLAEHCENLYNDMLFKKYYIVDNGKIVDTTGQYLIMDFPVKENQNKLGLSVYIATYEEEYDYWGWQICGADSDSFYKGYQIDNDTYRLITNDIEIDGYIGFYDKKDGSATGVKLHADKGVFAEGTTAVVNEITSGDDYDNAKKLISAEADKFHLYDVSFKDENGESAQPNGKFTISLPIPSDYANPVVYRIVDGKKTLISGTKADGMFTFSAKSTNAAGSADPSSTGAAFAVVSKKTKDK